MSAKLPWFEREFAGGVPVDKYPDIVERLRGTPARVEDKIRSVSPEIRTRRVGDTWTIQENVGHLLDLEPLWAGRVDDILDDTLAGMGTMREADPTNRKTHEAGHNSVSADALTAAFREIRMRFVTRMDRLDPTDFARSANHPRLRQPMRLVDLCLFVADHDDYHLARMTELADIAAREAAA